MAWDYPLSRREKEYRLVTIFQSELAESNAAVAVAEAQRRSLGSQLERLQRHGHQHERLLSPACRARSPREVRIASDQLDSRELAHAAIPACHVTALFPVHLAVRAVFVLILCITVARIFTWEDNLHTARSLGPLYVDDLDSNFAQLTLPDVSLDLSQDQFTQVYVQHAAPEMAEKLVHQGDAYIQLEKHDGADMLNYAYSGVTKDDADTNHEQHHGTDILHQSGLNPIPGVEAGVRARTFPSRDWMTSFEERQPCSSCADAPLRDSLENVLLVGQDDMSGHQANVLETSSLPDHFSGHFEEEDCRISSNCHQPSSADVPDVTAAHQSGIPSTGALGTTASRVVPPASSLTSKAILENLEDVDLQCFEDGLSTLVQKGHQANKSETLTQPAVFSGYLEVHSNISCDAHQASPAGASEITGAHLSGICRFFRPGDRAERQYGNKSRASMCIFMMAVCLAICFFLRCRRPFRNRAFVWAAGAAVGTQDVPPAVAEDPAEYPPAVKHEFPAEAPMMQQVVHHVVQQVAPVVQQVARQRRRWAAGILSPAAPSTADGTADGLTFDREVPKRQRRGRAATPEPAFPYKPKQMYLAEAGRRDVGCLPQPYPFRSARLREVADQEVARIVASAAAAEDAIRTRSHVSSGGG